MTDPLLRWFEYAHLPPHLQEVSGCYRKVAEWLDSILEPSAERDVALRKLLESKDAAVRARIASPSPRPDSIQTRET